MAPNLPLSLNNSGDSVNALSTTSGKKTGKAASRHSAPGALGETAETFKKALNKAQSSKDIKAGNGKSNATRPSVKEKQTTEVAKETDSSKVKGEKSLEADAAPLPVAEESKQAAMPAPEQEIAPVNPEMPIADLLPMALLAGNVLPGTSPVSSEILTDNNQTLAPIAASVTSPLPTAQSLTAAPELLSATHQASKPEQTAVTAQPASIDSQLSLAMAAQSSLMSTQAAPESKETEIPAETATATPDLFPIKPSELGQPIPVAMNTETEKAQVKTTAEGVEIVPSFNSAQDALSTAIPMAANQPETSLNSPAAFGEAMAVELQSTEAVTAPAEQINTSKTNRSNNSGILGSTAASANGKTNTAANKANDFLSSLKAGSNSEDGLQDTSLDETLEALNGSITLNQELPNNGQPFSNVLADVSSELGTESKSGDTKLPTFLSNAIDPMDQLTEGAVYGVKNGQRELIIRLNPDNLGEVRVSLISHAGGGLSAKLIASNPESNALLESQAQQLQASLEAKGVKLEKLSIMTAGQAEATNLLAGTEASNQSKTADQSFSPSSEQQQQDSMKQHGGQQNFNDNNNAFVQQMLGNGNYQNQSRHNLYNTAGTTRTKHPDETATSEVITNQVTTEATTRRQPGQTSILA